MTRALDLARRAEGRTAPNPMVGCVVAKNGEIVGEGWHEGPGKLHAEPAALSMAGASVKGATVYVTLEPCNHHGRTPPCVNALIAAEAAEVVYALADPNPIAAGGAEALRAAGIAVRSGVCEAEAADLNRAWLHGLATGRPYVIAKMAMSLDGRIATRTGQSRWITGAAARARGHDLRQMAGAIVVGAETVNADDPALTARPEGRGAGFEPADPIRVVLDSRGRTSPGAQAYDRRAPGAVLATTSAISALRLANFEKHGVRAFILDADENGRPDLNQLLARLFEEGVNCVLVEGGAQTLGSFFDAGLVDEVWAFIAPIVIGGAGKPSVAGLGVGALAEALRLDTPAVELLGSDLLIRGRINRQGAR